MLLELHTNSLTILGGVIRSKHLAISDPIARSEPTTYSVKGADTPFTKWKNFRLLSRQLVEQRLYYSVHLAF